MKKRTSTIVAKVNFSPRGKYSGWMKAAGTHSPVRKTRAEKIRDQFVKKRMDGSGVTSVEFDE